ncbi:hypothetical protein O181_120120 [Austropuccinia psidii MF-1]|uniref:Chromo domain-containing protein n=1 Tax=Austropuccinia psidii MF-1 TaxID=1389203 RepID=A0A9Q3KJK5_9BASI|nr:hypothetical protein [Austropuccinia psidii MF-1]
MEPDFKEGDQVLVSTLKFINLKGPNESSQTILSDKRGKAPLRKKTTTPPEIVEVEDSPGPVKKIIKARNIRLDSKGQRQYLVRLKNQTADNNQWWAEDAIPEGNLHLRRLRTSRRTKNYNQS